MFENNNSENVISDKEKSNKTGKRRPYLLTIRQSMSVKPQYNVYKGGMRSIYSIEGDISRHAYSIRKDGTEVMKLRKKLAKLLTEYIIEKEGREIAHVKKRISLLTHDLSGIVEDQSLEIRADWEAYRFDILVNGRKICRIESKSELFSDCYEMMMFDESMEELAVTLAVICDQVSDKEEKARARADE